KFCERTPSALSNAIAGGVWATGNTAVATITATGLATGVAAGTATISYSLLSGCSATAVVTVITSPPPVTGPVEVCAGRNITLSDTKPGGVWTSGNTVVAQVGTGGTVTGKNPGTAAITYSLGAGCDAYQNITVNAFPASISGLTSA